MARSVPALPTLQAPTCEIEGEVLEGNRYWEDENDVLVVIKADQSTTTEEYGPSHRILEVRHGRTCEVVFRTTLPVNTSPDFPYYLAPIQYNKVSNLVGIQGYYDIYVLDLANEYKLTKLEPEFFSERAYDDPQSGMIQRLEVWEHYLIGFAQDIGSFVFDLNEKDHPRAVLPFAEWRDPDTGRYHSLFLVPAEDGYQGIMPWYDAESGEYHLNPIFAEPRPLSLNVQKGARNNQFLVLRGTDGDQSIYPINLGSRELVKDVPAEVLAQGTQ
ncbi:MAG: hypothetical protein D6772_00185, partial [Bacteroidetes bacterium]